MYGYNHVENHVSEGELKELQQEVGCKVNAACEVEQEVPGQDEDVDDEGDGEMDVDGTPIESSKYRHGRGQ
jgi:hypothetical protein